MNYIKMSQREKSIVFIGFMGAGKTTIGQLVAKKLYRDFIDIDQEIEKEFKLPTSEIFKTIGEKAFREEEKTIISHYCQQKLKIISVGGGAFLQKEIRDICLSNCIVLYLDVSWEAWKKRLDLLVESRPILQNRTMEEIEQLFNQRQEIYSIHHSKFNTDHREVEDIADHIIETLKISWDIHEPNK